MAATTAVKAEKFDLDIALGAVPVNEAIPYVNWLIYGPPGAGKTYLAGTSKDEPECEPVLFLDVDKGTTTLRKFGKGIKVIPIESMIHLATTFEILANNPTKYRTVVVDSLTELQTMNMKDIMTELRSTPQGADRDPHVPGKREWGKSSSMMREVVRRFRDLPCNTIFTAHSKSIEEEQFGGSSLTTIMPNLPGKLATDVAGFIDIVGYLDVETQDGTIHRRLQVSKSRKIIAKDRLGVLGDVIVDPTMPKLYTRITESEDK
jgi:phage nucleotide-binding protein